MTDAPWLDAALQRFEARMARGQTPQALLIYGPAGVGRRYFALTVAARLLDLAWRPSLNVPAGILEEVPHPDCWAVGPADDSRVIRIDQVRDLIGTLSLTSHGNGRKVGLVFPADVMTHNAANTLLKTLEEPPGTASILLIADSPARLPATITSRCEQIRLSLPARAAALAWLGDRHADRSACERALAFATGAPLLARSLLGDDQAPGVSGMLAELGNELQSVVDRKSTPVAVARTWAKRDAAICLRWLYLQTAELLHRPFRQAGEPPSALLPLKIPGAAVNMAACCTHLDHIMEVQRLKDRSLNMEALFADLLMWWYGAAGAAR